MKERIYKKKDFWVVNNKGNVWIVGLFILELILIISFNFMLNLDHLSKINQIDPTFECVKIKIIQRIKKEFRENKIKDFEVKIDGYNVQVYYDVDRCEVIFDGKHYVEMNVIYDEVFWCLGSVEYDYEGWE